MDFFCKNVEIGSSFEWWFYFFVACLLQLNALLIGCNSIILVLGHVSQLMAYYHILARFWRAVTSWAGWTTSWWGTSPVQTPPEFNWPNKSMKEQKQVLNVLNKYQHDTFVKSTMYNVHMAEYAGSWNCVGTPQSP